MDWKDKIILTDEHNKLINKLKNMDLFEHYESLPLEVRAVLDKYAELDSTYDNCEVMQDELEALGYTFDWYLDATPYNLREMSVRDKK